jgi:hypothetical protein
VIDIYVPLSASMHPETLSISQGAVINNLLAGCMRSINRLQSICFKGWLAVGEG